MTSYNNALKEAAQEELELMNLQSDVLFDEQNLYSNIVYFHRISNNIDADNLSKPILDALRTIVYKDDVQILKRTVTKIDLNANYSLSNENVPLTLYNKLLEATNDNSTRHLLFVEIGIVDMLEVTFGR